jgi:hypothetical protein
MALEFFRGNLKNFWILENEAVPKAEVLEQAQIKGENRRRGRRYL